MRQVERHIINDNRFQNICNRSGLLYNFVTYHYKQALFGKQEYFTEFEMSKLCVEFNQENYRSLPAQTSQQVIKQVFINFKSFTQANKEYFKNPNKFLKKPKLPKYKEGKKQNIVIFTNQQLKLKEGFIHFPKKENIKPIKTKIKSINQVRIIPNPNCYIIEIVYDKKEIDLKLNEKNFLAIDLGLNNFVTTVNNVGLQPFIINGKIVKSFNHWYNKKKAKLQSFTENKGTSKKLYRLINYRNNFINDKMHKQSKLVINYCIENNIGTIVIGKNNNWKQNINLGKKTNQKFTEIPHTKYIQKITYKAKLIGINVIETEESYTSKVDHLAFEKLKKQEFYLGKRVKRGLFQSSTNKIINSDCNGAIGISRKVFDDSIVKEIINSGLVFNPYKVNVF